jgi:hypothetical protein
MIRIIRTNTRVLTVILTAPLSLGGTLATAFAQTEVRLEPAAPAPRRTINSALSPL